MKAPVDGVLGDCGRPVDVRDIEGVRAGESIITRVHLAEIAGRRAVASIDTLIAACGRLLDEMEHSVAMVVSVGELAAGCI